MMYSSGKAVLAEHIINKVASFFERLLFKNKEETLSARLAALDLILHEQFDITLEQISSNPFQDLIPKLEKMNSDLVNYIISILFEVLINEYKIAPYEKLNTNHTLKQRITELIYFVEKKHSKLSLETLNIKNCLKHMSR